MGSQDDINNDDNDVSNDVNASLRCRVIDDYLSFGCDWSHAMYLVNYIYKFSGNSHDRPVQGRVGQLSPLLIRAVDKLLQHQWQQPIWTTKRKSYLLVLTRSAALQSSFFCQENASLLVGVILATMSWVDPFSRLEKPDERLTTRQGKFNCLLAC